jgi:hypothetical protein
VRPALGEAAELDELEHGGHALGDLGLRHAVLLQSESDVLLDVHVREKCIGLEHHVDRPLIRRHAGHVLAVDQYPAGARRLETPEHAQERRLAATRCAEQAEDLALVDLEADVVNRLEIAERLRDPLDLDVRTRARIPPRRGLDRIP